MYIYSQSSNSIQILYSKYWDCSILVFSNTCRCQHYQFFYKPRKKRTFHVTQAAQYLNKRSQTLKCIGRNESIHCDGPDGHCVVATNLNHRRLIPLCILQQISWHMTIWRRFIWWVNKLQIAQRSGECGHWDYGR